AGRAGRGRRGALAVVAVLGLATWPLAGHPGAAPSAGGTVATDTVHLGAMAVWLGGLVMLIGFLLRRAHPRQLALIMPAWSRWAAAAVCWLVVAGVAQAAVELGTPAALLGTAYGRLVVAKAALLAAVLGVAAYARRLAHRRADRPARSRLRWAVGTELGGTAVVLALSAVLVQTTPGRAAVAEARAAAAEGFAQTLTSPLYTLQFEIYPVQLGENNTVHAAAYTPAGKPLPVVEWTLTAALPARGVEPATSYLLGVRPHQGLGAVTFPVPGEWRLRFTLRVSDVEQASVSTTVRVTSPGPSAAPAPR
ncbi:MAG TPA: CopD family protein, partial [Pilimelia sp.]|nr:CopD family protein [Pilimelia sp.]